MDMPPELEKLALDLFDIGAVKFGEFKLKLHETQPDAPLSPIYFDIRTPENKSGPLDARVLGLIGQAMYDRSKELNLEFDHIAGIPEAGEPLAKAFNWAAEADLGAAHRLFFKKIIGSLVRKIGELYGVLFGPDQSLLILDDLVTEADTKLEAAESTETAKLRVTAFLVLIDREQGGRDKLEAAGYQVVAIFKITELLPLYVANGRIDQAKADEVLAYIKANRKVAVG